MHLVENGKRGSLTFFSSFIGAESKLNIGEDEHFFPDEVYFGDMAVMSDMYEMSNIEDLAEWARSCRPVTERLAKEEEVFLFTFSFSSCL